MTNIYQSILDSVRAKKQWYAKSANRIIKLQKKKNPKRLLDKKLKDSYEPIPKKINPYECPECGTADCYEEFGSVDYMKWEMACEKCKAKWDIKLAAISITITQKGKDTQNE